MLKVQSISVSGMLSHIWVICIISIPVAVGMEKLVEPEVKEDWTQQDH